MVAATSIGVAYAVVAIVAIVAGVDVTATAVPGSKPIGASKDIMAAGFADLAPESAAFVSVGRIIVGFMHSF